MLFGWQINNHLVEYFGWMSDQLSKLHDEISRTYDQEMGLSGCNFYNLSINIRKHREDIGIMMNFSLCESMMTGWLQDDSRLILSGCLLCPRGAWPQKMMIMFPDPSDKISICVLHLSVSLPHWHTCSKKSKRRSSHQYIECWEYCCSSSNLALCSLQSEDDVKVCSSCSCYLSWPRLVQPGL